MDKKPKSWRSTMKTLEQGSQRIQKICDILKTESLEPAKKEAEKIIADAHARAQHIVKEAEKQAEGVISEMRKTNEQEKHVFQSALTQSARLTIEALKQEIQNKLFNQEFYHLVEQSTSDPKLISKLIEALIKGIEKDGLSTNFTVIIPKTISQKEVNSLLGDHILKKLKEESVTLGEFTGGAQIKLHDKNITIDMTPKALMEMLSSYAPNFRKWIFAS